MIRGKKYNYLSMILNYYSKEKLKLNIAYYMDNMVKEFSEKLNSKGKVPQNDSLFNVNIKSPILDIEKAKLLYSFMIKIIFLVKRAKYNLKPGFIFLLI